MVTLSFFPPSQLMAKVVFFQLRMVGIAGGREPF